MYPDMTGNNIRANDPADANQPNNSPCGRRPTTMVRNYERCNQEISIANTKNKQVQAKDSTYFWKRCQ